MKINHLDLFSGIGGFHLGFEKAGFEVNSYFSEIDKYAIDVYKNNFKNSKYVGSVTDVRAEQLPRIDAITFGSPCQDFSLAGKRKGMGGDRSSLITEAIRLIDECRPRFFIWENVKGTFSSNNGEDFWAIIQAFTNIGGYRLEWQLLNTKWFLPQNRERIYLVGYLGDGSGGQVFPIRESNKQINELQRQQTNTCCLTTRYGADGNGSYLIERKLNAQTLDTTCNQAVLKTNYTYKKVNETIIKNKDKFIKGDVKALDFYNKSVKKESPCLTDPKHNNVGVFNGKSIRRLTPIECERLQGFPDNWTEYGESGKISDTQRYKMCGNAVTVDVVEAVAKNIIKVIK